MTLEQAAKHLRALAEEWCGRARFTAPLYADGLRDCARDADKLIAKCMCSHVEKRIPDGLCAVCGAEYNSAQRASRALKDQIEEILKFVEHKPECRHDKCQICGLGAAAHLAFERSHKPSGFCSCGLGALLAESIAVPDNGLSAIADIQVLRSELESAIDADCDMWYLAKSEMSEKQKGALDRLIDRVFGL